MRLFFLVMLFCGVAKAKQGISIRYGEEGKTPSSVFYELDQKNKVYSFDDLEVMCAVEFSKGSVIIFCDQKQNGTGAVFQCDGNPITLTYQSKKKKKRYGARIECVQDKI